MLSVKNLLAKKVFKNLRCSRSTFLLPKYSPRLSPSMLPSFMKIGPTNYFFDKRLKSKCTLF